MTNPDNRLTKGRPAICSIIFSIIAILSGLAWEAPNTIDSLRSQLKTAASPADSLSILFNIYDCTLYEQRGEILEEVYNAADRAGNDDAKLDVIRLMAGLYEDSDSMRHVILNKLDKLPDSDKKKSMDVYVKARYATKAIRDLPESELQKKLHHHLAKYKEFQSLGVYDRIEYLFYLCAYLRSSTDGELLIKYLHELAECIEDLEQPDLALKSLLYSQAAKSFFNNDMYKEAVEANKKMLEINSEFDRMHEAQGRIYRNYAGSTYFCYYNMLMCSEVLTPEEIETCYRRMRELEDTTPRLFESTDLRKRAKAYYLMAKKDYVHALPLIKEQLELDIPREEYGFLVEALIEAAKNTGAKADLLYALKINNVLLQERLEVKTDKNYKELQTLYEVNELRQQNNNLEKENKQFQESHNDNQISAAIIAMVIVFIILAIVYTLYRKSQRLTNGLRISNKILTDERDALRAAQADLVDARDKAKAADRIKTDFVNNLNREIKTPLSAIVEYSHLMSDFAMEDHRDYIRRFGDIISRNTDLLTTLVNDVLELPSLENARLSVCIQPASVKDICHWAMVMVAKHVNPGVRLIFAGENRDDVSVRTDPHRVEQVLLNMLLNAAKFTDRGSITLDYQPSDDLTELTFSVTDTGIGIPKGAEEKVFGRFEKLSSTYQGNGLGLYICKLLADLLNGKISIDSSYRKGARFTFTIPVNL